jgi:outer membrane protein TolC
MREGMRQRVCCYLPVTTLILVAILSLPGSSQAVTLETCIKTALENNPDIQAGVTRIHEAKYMIKQAESAYYPRLYLSGAYSVTDNPPQAFMMSLNQKDLDIADPKFDPNDPDHTDNMRLSLGLKYRVYDGGVKSIHVQMAKESKQLRELGLRAVQNELIHQVTRGYYGVLQAQSFVAVQEESVKSLKESLRIATARFNAGSAVKTDVLNLEVKLAQAREDTIRAKNGVRLAIASLNTAIGSDLILTNGLPVPAREEIWEKPESLDFSVIENRPELKATHTLSNIKKHSWEKVFREHRPTMSAFGSYDFDSGDFSEFENSCLMGVMAEWEFFDGYQRQSQARVAKAQWQTAKKETLKARNDLRLDLQQAYLKAMDAWERLEVSEKSIESAGEALRITSELYKQGVADISVLLTAQVGLTTQKTRSVAAYYDYLTALSNYDRARGVGVEKYIK